MKRTVTFALIASTMMGVSAAHAMGSKPAKEPDLVDKVIDLIEKTPANIEKIEKQREQEAKDWKTYDKMIGKEK